MWIAWKQFTFTKWEPSILSCEWNGDFLLDVICCRDYMASILIAIVFRFRDTVGTLIALHAIGVISVSASKLPLGEGMVWTDHGCLPVPAPATLRLLIDMPVCKVRSRLYVMHILTP